MLHTADSARRVGASMTAASVCILSRSACSAPKEPGCSPRRAARTAWMAGGSNVGTCRRQLSKVPKVSKVARCRICLYRRSGTAVMRSGAAARPVLHLRCVLVTTRGGCGLGRPLFRREGKPAVEVVEDGFDRWPQLGGDLPLDWAPVGAASGRGDDDLEDAGGPDSPQLCDLGRDFL